MQPSRTALLLAAIAPFTLAADDSREPIAVQAARPAYTFVGLHTAPVPASLRAHVDLPEGAGLVVRAVVTASPAERAGLQKHDILTHLEDQLLINPAQLRSLVRAKRPGDTLIFTYLRQGNPHTAEVTLAERQPRDFQSRARHQYDDVSEELGDAARNIEQELEALRDAGVPIDMDRVREHIREARDRAAEAMEAARQEIESIDIEEALEEAGVIDERASRSTLVYEGTQGSLRLVISEDHSHLTARDADANLLYDGELPEDRSELPESVQEMLARLEID